jgi:hypothetical protein
MASQHATTSREQAERRAKIVFAAHSGVYVGVNALLAYLDLTRSPDRIWFFWPLVGWGTGLAAHAIGVFGTGRAIERTQHRMQRRAERGA